MKNFMLSKLFYPTFFLVMTCIIALIPVTTVQALDCTGDIYLSSQAEVNAFDCSTVEGNLIISNTADIDDLSPLAILTSVGGFLMIRNNHALTNLDGLENITSVGRFLYISNNNALINLDGLSTLSSLGSLSIKDNEVLTNLEGLANALTVKLDRCKLNPFTNQINAFVNAGILTPEQAADLIAAAEALCSEPAPAMAVGSVEAGQSYPNPCDRYTFITFQLQEEETVRLEVYDVAGKLMLKPLQFTLPSGPHKIKVNTSDLPEGFYYFSLKSRDFSRTTPIVVSRTAPKH